jgi:WD40 repeat protein
MADKPGKKSAEGGDGNDEFFNVGAPLHAVRPGYIKRPADDLLYSAIISGHYAHVIAPDRTGKSSLIAATSARLQHNGVKVAVLNLAQIGERDGGTDAGRWYYSIAYRLLRQFRLKVDLQNWWQDKSFLSNRQRLVEFYAEIVLQNIQDKVVVFVDEVQHVAGLTFAEQLLASIRAAYNARTTEPEFTRLTFVLIGECDPLDLAKEPQSSPFSISQEIRLGDFTRQDLNVFATELNLSPTDADEALDRVFYWTGGQPYLSQKLARCVAREQISDDIAGGVDRLATRQLAGRAALNSEPHLSHIHRVAISDRKKFEPLLTLYGRIRKGIEVEIDPEESLHRQLLAIGLVEANEQGTFQIRNRVYENVFTARWANENLPLRWRGPAIAAGVALLIIAIPFAYTQLLPKPYMRVMSTPALDIASVSDAYVNLRSFPGHADAAARMFRTILDDRARQATDKLAIQEVVRYAALLPEQPGFAESLSADFWDRQVNLAIKDERRDAALLASIESFIVSTPERRRRAATLVGDDYSLLLATIPAQQADGLVFNADNMQLSYYAGAQISQWSPADQGLQENDSWTISALEVSPMVRRVIVDREGVTSRIGLTVNVSHSRFDDIRMKLIAPSGRAVELVFAETASAANEEIRVSREQLAPLVGESLNGTWSLSIRDESTGVSGHLMGWKLSLNSQVVVESFERGLDIPDPVERPSENLWFSPDGRYAIARALQSDSARLWDLSYARAARTIAVSANERLLGLSANAEFLLTATQDTVNLWRTSNGRRAAVLDVGAAAADASLSTDGLHILTSYKGDLDTRFELWSIASGDVVAEFTIAGAPALVSIDAAANHIAVADYDRAVRIWNLRSGELRSQIDLEYQPSQISLSANGAALGVIHGEQGVSLWLTGQPAAPVLQEWGRNEWHMVFSPSGTRFLAGNHRQGYQVYRSQDGVPSGPLLDTGIRSGEGELLAFGGDENFVVAATTNDIARYWQIPATSVTVVDGSSTGAVPDHQILRESGNLITALGPGGERLAIADASGHVHIQQIEAHTGAIDSGAEDISFLGHRSAVVGLTFSADGSLVASAGADGSIRIWDAHSGLPRPFYGRASVSTIERMAFSPSGHQLAVLSGQRAWIMHAESGALLADIDLGELHTDLIFALDQQIYLGAESGTLRNLYADRTGNWHLRNVWQNDAAIRQLAVSPGRQQVVVVDANNQATLLDPADGRVGAAVLQLPDSVIDVAFSPSESRVLFNTPRWIHRALVSPGGLFWADAIRGPKAMAGSGMVFDVADESAANSDYASDAAGDRVLMLTRDTGLVELAELRFSYSDGPALIGTRTSLISHWTEKLRGPQAIGFVREGF